MKRRLAEEDGMYILRRPGRLAQYRLARERRGVRRRGHDIVQGQERLRRGCGLRLEHVDPGARDPALLHGARTTAPIQGSSHGVNQPLT